jgi:Flp pilus assembly protein TadG
MTIQAMRKLSSFHSSQDGATAVEGAIVLFAFVLLIFGMVQFAEIFWTWNTMMLALGEGGRFAMVYNPTNNPNGLAASNCTVASPTLATCAVAQANNTLATYPSLSVTVSCTAGCTTSPPPALPPTTMTLQGTFTFNFITSNLLPFGPITMTQQLTVPLS